MRKAAFIHSPKLESFIYPPQCPFDVSRAGKTRKIIDSMGLLSAQNVTEIAPEPAERMVLKKFHSARYLHVLKESAEGKFQPQAFSMGIGTPDCPVFDDMYEYSIWACGASLTGVKLILSGAADVAFNSSGGLHHAGPELASGFCYMNDVAIACMVLADAQKKVLYLDIDVHHGDGVQNAFYARNDVLTISLHQNGRTLFPGTGFEDEIGIGPGKGYSVNVPLPIGTYDEAYMKAFKAIAPPLIKAYDPDVIVLQAGADALAGDPLAHLQLTNNTYADVINELLSFEKPILATGGGGYHVGNTVRAWALDWSVLTGQEKRNENAGQEPATPESAEWQGGVRDIPLTVTKQQEEIIIPQIDVTIEKIKSSVFPIHGI